LEKTKAEFGDVLYYAEVRWLGRVNVLRRFFNSRGEVEIFMNEKSKSVPELSDAEWIVDLAFFVNITSLLNKSKTKLRGKENVSPMHFQISKHSK
jgi:hypothetical protein